MTKQADNGVAFNPTVEAGVVNALQQECGETARDHGFTQDWEDAAWLEGLARSIRMAQDESDLPGEDDAHRLEHIAAVLRNNIIGTKLMLMVSELSEALESLRKNDGAQGVLDGKGNFHEELADTIVRILDTGAITKGNLGDELLKKMAINKGREHMHGKVM